MVAALLSHRDKDPDSAISEVDELVVIVFDFVLFSSS
jgi:hypothetical protein